MMNANELAGKLHNYLAQKTDGQGKPITITPMMQDYAAGFINSLKAASFVNAPGTINGAVSIAGVLSGGIGIGGLFVGLTPGPWLQKTMPGNQGPMVPVEKAAVITYMIGAGLIGFNGTIMGPAGAWGGTGGKVTGVQGAACAAAVQAATGLSGPDMIKHYTILMNYILEKLEATYPPGTVFGSYPPLGGPLAGGGGAGGTIA